MMHKRPVMGPRLDRRFEDQGPAITVTRTPSTRSSGEAAGLRLAALAATMLLVGVSSTQASPDKFNISPEEHAACDADAQRLCSATYPDTEKMIACMKANRTDLDPICKSTFEAGMRKRHLAL